MIDCMTPDDMWYFVSLIPDIVEFISQELIVVHAEQGDVYWELLYGKHDAFCKMPTTEI